MKAILAIFFAAKLLADAGNGLPSCDLNESDLYRWDNVTRFFTRIATGYEQEKEMYVRYSFHFKRWMWVTGKDMRPILAGSKAQGYRIGVRGTNKLNWFRLDKQNAVWKLVFDRERPQLVRYDAQQNRRVVSEQASDGWEYWGGEVEGNDTNPNIKCELSASPQRIAANEMVTLTLKTDSEAQEATIAGTAVTPPLSQRILLLKLKGTQRIEATVKTPKGSGSCYTEVIVE